jgi:hypothetical protein
MSSAPEPQTFVLCRTIRPLLGRCPSCENPLDLLGCRILERYRPPRAIRRRTGIAELIKIECQGDTVLREIPCPCCQTHPGDRVCPHSEHKS